jgi:hypothetical protein
MKSFTKREGILRAISRLIAIFALILNNVGKFYVQTIKPKI